MVSAPQWVHFIRPRLNSQVQVCRLVCSFDALELEGSHYRGATVQSFVPHSAFHDFTVPSQQTKTRAADLRARLLEVLELQMAAIVRAFTLVQNSFSEN